MRSGIQPHRAFIAYLLTTVLLAGCQSTREQLLGLEQWFPSVSGDGGAFGRP